MTFELNIFQNIYEASPQAHPLVKTLLKSFPLSKACVETLQERLFENLEYGFFSSQTKLISQGETGNDLFLICTHKVDIVVNGERVLQMPAPDLFGDKGLVAKSSTRSATVSISKGGNCFVLKLPIGMFIHDFKDSKIQDKAFSQEAQIFHKIFQIIQERLFKYIHLQKQVWEEVTTTLDLLNHQLISSFITGKKDQKWCLVVEQAIKDHFSHEFKYEWPNDIPLNNSAIHQVLSHILEKRFSNHGTSTAVLKQKNWKKWVRNLTTVILKYLPKEQHPINIGDIEMFNPKNYQLGIQRYLVKIESQLKKKTGVDPTEDYSRLKFNNFFKSSIDANAFELRRYLEALVETFPIKTPNRIFANISQQVANITAQSENEFNRSISRMQHFLKKAYQLVSPAEEKKLPVSFLMNLKNRYFPLISNAMKADKNNYENAICLLNRKKPIDLCEISTISSLIDSASSKTVRENLKQAFLQIISAFKLKIPRIKLDDLFSFFHVIEIPIQRQLSSQSLKNCFLIPLTDNLSVTDGIVQFPAFSPGTIVGNTFFEREDSRTGKTKEKWHFTCLKKSTKENYAKRGIVLLFKLPIVETDSKTFVDVRKWEGGVVQWIIDQYLKQIHEKYLSCSQLHKKLVKIIAAEHLERQVQQFEKDRKPMEVYKYGLLLDSVQDLTDIKLPFKETISPAIFSKQLYNAIVSKINAENPNLKLEERGNKAYTLWRYVQSKVVMELPLETSIGKDDLPSPKRVLLHLKKELKNLLSQYNLDQNKLFISIGETKSYVHLTQIMEKIKSSEDEPIMLPNDLLNSLEFHFRDIYKEFFTLNNRISEIGASNKKNNPEALQVAYINGIISKIQRILLKSYP